MAYYIIKRVYLDGRAHFRTLRFDTLDECVDHSNRDRADCLIQAETLGIIDYRIDGRWKQYNYRWLHDCTASLEIIAALTL
jgi:hypothetical protein